MEQHKLPALASPPLPAQVVLARSVYPDGIPCALTVKLRGDLAPSSEQEGQGGQRQRVVEWASAEELAAHLQRLVEEA